MIIEKPSGRNEQSIIVGTWSWIGCEIRARTSFWEVSLSLLWCPGGPFADWPSMSSPHCWGAQCSKNLKKWCLLSLILGTVLVKQEGKINTRNVAFNTATTAVHIVVIALFFHFKKALWARLWSTLPRPNFSSSLTLAVTSLGAYSLIDLASWRHNSSASSRLSTPCCI